MNCNSGLGKYLLSARKRSKISQRKLADKLGCSSGQFVSNYERGVCPVPIDMIRKIIAILDLDPHEVIKVMQQDRLMYLRNSLLSENSVPRKNGTK